MKKKLFTASLIWFSSHLVMAQSSIDLFTFSGFYGAPSTYQTPPGGRATESGTLLNLKVPVVLSEKTIWYNDFTHTLFNIDTDLSPGPSTMLTSMGLHAFILQTGIARKLNDRNGFQLLLVPRYNSDMKGSTEGRWQFGMVGLYEHRQNEKLLWRFGALYNQELFGPLVVPLVYIDYQLSDRWSIVGLAPINLKVNYRINDRFTTGFSHFAFITTYRIGNDPFRTDYIERNSIDESIFLRWKMAGNFHFETRVGYSLGRIYEHYAADQKMDFRLSLIRFGDERVKENVSFGNGAIASLRLVYNLPLK